MWHSEKNIGFGVTSLFLAHPPWASFGALWVTVLHSLTTWALTRGCTEDALCLLKHRGNVIAAASPTFIFSSGVFKAELGLTIKIWTWKRFGKVDRGLTPASDKRWLSIPGCQFLSISVWAGQLLFLKFSFFISEIGITMPTSLDFTMIRNKIWKTPWRGLTLVGYTKRGNCQLYNSSPFYF